MKMLNGRIFQWDYLSLCQFIRKSFNNSHSFWNGVHKIMAEIPLEIWLSIPFSIYSTETHFENTEERNYFTINIFFFNLCMKKGEKEMKEPDEKSIFDENSISRIEKVYVLFINRIECLQQPIFTSIDTICFW